MVKNTPKRHQNGFRTYSNKQLEDALAEIQRGSSVRQAATLYKIPFSSLLSYSRSVTPVLKKMGPKPNLIQYEDVLVEWILKMQRRRFPVSHSELLNSVRKIVTQQKMKLKPPG